MEEITEQLFYQMSDDGSDPNLERFSEVYVQALEILDQKINLKQQEIDQFENDKIEIANQKKNLTKNVSKDGDKKFVFRIMDSGNLHDLNPNIKMKHGKMDLLIGDLTKFTEGEIIIPVKNNYTQIDVKFFSEEDQESIYIIYFLLSSMTNKKRVSEKGTFSYDGQDYEFIYDGQLIEGPIDFYDGLLDSKNNQIRNLNHELVYFEDSRSNLEHLFPRNSQNSRVSSGLFKPATSNILKTNPEFTHFGVESTVLQSPNDNNYQNITDQIQAKEPKFTFAPLTENNEGVYPLKNANGQVFQSEDRAFNSTNNDLAQPTQRGSSINNFDFSNGFKNLNVQAMISNFQDSPYSWHQHVHTLFYVNLVLLLFSFFVNWHRSSFLSLIISLSYAFWYLVKDELNNLLSPKFYGIGYAIAAFFDILWISSNSANLISNGSLVSSHTLAGVEYFTFVSTFFLVFFEIACTIIAFFLNSSGVFTLEVDRMKKEEIEVDLMK